MVSLWDKPSAHEATIAMSAVHGLPDFAGASRVNWGDTSFPLEAANRLKGIDITEAEDAAALAAMDTYRRWLFHSLCVRWPRLLSITQGPRSTAYAAYGYYEAGGATGSAAANFVDKLDCAASGAGTTVYVTWTEGGWSPVTYLQPGAFVADHGTGFWGMTQIEDGHYEGESGGTHTVRLTLRSPLNANRESKLWIYRENYPRALPAFQLLREDRAICARCVRVKHSFFKSFKEVYGAEGIDGYYYCTFLDWPGALIEGFTSECKQTACPYYQRPRARDMEPAQHTFDAFFLNPGDRVRQMTFAAYGTLAYFVAERCGYEGLFAMLGVPMFRDTDGLHLLSSDLMARTVLCDTGEVYGREVPRKMGFRVFGDFATVEAQRTRAGLVESDAIGLLEKIAPSYVQGDQMGGALVTTASRTPGVEIEKRTTRSIGHAIVDPGDGLGAGEHVIYGHGLAGAQRPLARELTSRPIVGPLAAGAYGANVDEETRITLLPEAVSLGWIDPAAPLVASALGCRVVWEFGRFGDSVTDPLEEKLKDVATYAVKAGALNGAGNLLYLEFALGQWHGYRGGAPQAAPDLIPYCAGANVVCASLSWESRNPGSGALLGGRQGRLFPGDAIEFSGDASIEGARGTVVAAQAYGGAWDAAANMPEGIPFLPAALMANYGYRDTCTIALEGVSGRELQGAQQAGLFASGAITISRVGLLSVVPPNVDHNGSSRSESYAVSRITDDEDLTALVEGVDYVLDRALGMVFLAESVFAGAGSHKVHFDGSLFCSQSMLPLEEAAALDKIITDVETEGYLPVDMNYGTQAIALTMVRISNGDVADHWEWSLVGTPAEDTGWDIEPGGLPNPFSLMATQYPSTAEWRKVTLAPGVGAKIGHQYTNTSGSANAWAMRYDNQAHAIEFFPPKNLCSAEIKSAFMNLDFEGATVHRTTYAWDWNANPINVGSTAEVDEINLRLLCCIIETDPGDTDLITSITPIAIDASTTLSCVDVPDDPYNPASATVSHLRGTMDITAILQYICAHQHELSTAQQFYVLINGNEAMTGGNANPWSLVESWVGAWDMVVATLPVPHENQDEHGGVSGSIDGHWIEYADLTVSAPIMQLEPGALAAGVVPHIDESGLALVPELTAVGS